MLEKVQERRRRRAYHNNQGVIIIPISKEQLGLAMMKNVFHFLLQVLKRAACPHNLSPATITSYFQIALLYFFLRDV